MGRFLNLLKQSLIAVKAYKLRTFFSLLGIAFGVASLSIIVAAVQGSYYRAYEIIDVFGPESILVFSGSREERGIRQRKKTLTMKDIEVLKQNIPQIKLIMPVLYIDDAQVYYKGNIITTKVYGVSTQFEEAWNWYLIEGRMFNRKELETKKNVCVIGLYIKQELFKNEEAVGKMIVVNRLPCKVLGVLSRRGTTPTGRNLDDRILMPYTTVMAKINHDFIYVNSIRIRFEKGSDVEKLVEKVRQILRQNHHLRPEQSDDFFILSPTEIIRFLVNLTGTLVLFLGLSSVISLTVGGFVLANLFLLSVNERKKEIGIRRAVGAKKSDILLQFIIEAVMITVIGSVLGFLLAFVGAHFLTKIAQFPIKFSFVAFGFAVFVSVIVGLLSVLNPALKAARLNPIEAIRE
ncbi:putative ABC transport system permease protein [Persephonella hydrogeniphila]|uniref:Putative ABC transport system permease protein n=1 Tax=Persephonella hydrogeniphila TaxID=198703 RepID=A0A285N3G2_9AQUI|nr:ABC transporter permease [Persephonella hydrogeniphila]SNZ03970.1 putative ABC transport system permease protein [Persephonella hydrogeniphila]